MKNQKAKFKVGQVVAYANDDSVSPFKISSIEWDANEFWYRSKQRGHTSVAVAERILRALTKTECQRQPAERIRSI